MNSIKKKINKTFGGSALLPQILTGVTVVLACALLFVSNTGCDLMKKLTTYLIEFSPPYFALKSPGQQGVVTAELIWSADGDTRNLEAESWTLLPGIPAILESATCSPTQNSVYTDISLKCSSDASRFGASDLWTASASSAYMIGVRASFVEPVWKSVSGGQKATIARKAFLPLRVENPKVQVIQTGHHNYNDLWTATFTVGTENPLEGWTYYVKAYAKEIYKATGAVTNYASYERTWQGAGGGAFPPTGLNATPSDDIAAAYAVFEIEYRNAQGTKVREERKVFNF